LCRCTLFFVKVISHRRNSCKITSEVFGKLCSYTNRFADRLGNSLNGFADEYGSSFYGFF